MRISTTIIAAALAFAAAAVPAKRTPFTVTQHDGTTVTLRHSGGYQTTYACLQATPAVEQGDTVTAGQVIGAVGTTAAAESAQGPHLHFSVTKDGDAVDTDEYLNK